MSGFQAVPPAGLPKVIIAMDVVTAPKSGTGGVECKQTPVHFAAPIFCRLPDALLQKLV
jgi:hypothetical protein